MKPSFEKKRKLALEYALMKARVELRDLEDELQTPYYEAVIEGLKSVRTIVENHDRYAKQLEEEFRIKSTCDSCGYQSMDILPTSMRCCTMINCNGMMI